MHAVLADSVAFSVRFTGHFVVGTFCSLRSCLFCFRSFLRFITIFTVSTYTSLSTLFVYVSIYKVISAHLNPTTLWLLMIEFFSSLHFTRCAMCARHSFSLDHRICLRIHSPNHFWWCDGDSVQRENMSLQIANKSSDFLIGLLCLHLRLPVSASVTV